MGKQNPTGLAAEMQLHVITESLHFSRDSFGAELNICRFIEMTKTEQLLTLEHTVGKGIKLRVESKVIKS